MAKYQVIGDGSPIDGVKDTETGAFIPNAPGNRHWQEYLVWLTEGSPLNTPDPDPAQSGANLKLEKHREIDGLRDAEIASGITFQSNDYQTDKVSRDNLTATVAVIAAGGTIEGGSPEFTWKNTANDEIPMDDATVTAFGSAVHTKGNIAYKTSWVLKDQVDAISDSDPDIKSKLAAIVWPS